MVGRRERGRVGMGVDKLSKGEGHTELAWLGGLFDTSMA